MGEKKLLKVAEAAAYLTLSQFYLYRLVETGAIPTIRLGRSIRFDPAELDEWINDRRRPATCNCNQK